MIPDILASFDLTAAEWLLAVLCGMLVGTAKTGISGSAMLVVPVLAGIFGGRPSTGLLLPMLSMGDVFGVAWYHMHADWGHIRRLMPWTIAGIGAGLVVGGMVTAETFRLILAGTILAGLAVMIWRESRGDGISVPRGRWFSALMGVAGGFTTMIGNAAGPVMALYLLSMRLPKYAYIGTAAWFFMIVNLMKIPLHVIFWKTIPLRTLAFDLAMLPAIAAGAFIGVRVVRYIPEKTYRAFIMAMTALAAVKLMM